jgi:heme exporter protein A
MDSKTSNEKLTVKENIKFWHKLFLSKISDNEIDSILKLLSIDRYLDTLISNLSYGETKKLELSRLIIEQKKLWILDEPYIGLDDSSSDLINQTIINHAAIGGMVIFTSHIVPAIHTLNTIELKNNA